MAGECDLVSRGTADYAVRTAVLMNSVLLQEAMNDGTEERIRRTPTQSSSRVMKVPGSEDCRVKVSLAVFRRALVQQFCAQVFVVFHRLFNQAGDDKQCGVNGTPWRALGVFQQLGDGNGAIQLRTDFSGKFQRGSRDRVVDAEDLVVSD